MFQHHFGMEISNQKADVVILKIQFSFVNMLQKITVYVRECRIIIYTCIGVRLNIIKFSARNIIKRINLWQRIFSISSACLTAILTRIEFTELSIKTFSFSLRLIMIGVKSNSLLLLTSISGLLCRSITWEEKFWRHIAAVNEDLTAFR